MQNSNYQLILTEPNGNYAIPDIEITDELETSFSIQSVADITKRRDTLTKNITFPGTKNNNRIFNNLYSLNRSADGSLEEVLFSNYSPVVGVRAVLYENNYPLVSGTLTISNIDKDKATGAFTYSGVVVGNLVTFFGKLKDVLLEDLNMFDQEVNYTWDNIKNSWGYSDTKTFVIPSIDYGKGIAPNRAKMDLRNYRPAIYLRWYLTKLLSHFGYKYRSTFIDSDIFKRIYIPFAAQEFAKTISGSVVTINGGSKPAKQLNTGTVSTVFTGLFYDDFVVNEYVNMSVQTLHGINGGWGRNNVRNDKQATVFEIKKPALVGASIDFSFDIYAHGENGVNVYIELYRMEHYQIDNPFGSNRPPLYVTDYMFNCDSPIANKNTYVGGEFRNQWKTLSGTIALPVGNYDAGYRFALVITTVPAKPGGVDFRQNETKIIFSNPDASVGALFPYNLGETFNLNEAVPLGVKAIDFLKSVFTIFNIYAIENPADDTELILEPYDIFYSKANNPAIYATDWTKKVDNSSLGIAINTALPRSYEFKFKEESDYYNTLYKSTYGVGYGDLSVDNKIGTATPQEIITIFAATPIVTENKDDKTLPAIWKGEILNKASFKSALRLLYNNGVASCQGYDIAITKGDSDSVGYDDKVKNVYTYQVSHHVLTMGGEGKFNLVFGLPKAVYYTVKGDIFDVPTLYSLFSDQLIELDDINIFTLKLDCHLRDYDINGLDLTRPVFISTTQGMAYFKIMSVTYFNNKEVSNVVLQKIVFKEAIPSDVADLPDPTEPTQPIPNPTPNPPTSTQINCRATVKGSLIISGYHYGVTPGSNQSANLSRIQNTIEQNFYNPSNYTESVTCDLVINGELYYGDIYYGAIYSIVIYNQGAAIIPAV